MQLSTIILLGVVSALFASAGAVEVAVVTPAPVSPIHEALRRHQAEREVIQNLIWRQLEGDGNDFCYGIIGNLNGICTFYNTLSEKCTSFDTSGDYASYWKCLCGNGAVTAQTECDWCQDAFGIGLGINATFAESQATSECVSYSVSIAPLPASMLALGSSFNASYTGTLPPSNSSTGSGPVRTSSASGKQTNSASLPTSTSVQTLNGGGGAAPTTTPNQGQSPTSPTGAVKTGSATGWGSADPVLFLGVMFGMVISYLM